MDEDTDFFKRLPRQRSSKAQHETELTDARSSIYRWWFEYLKLSKDYWWLTKISNHRSDDVLFQKVWENFGDIYKYEFDDWWLSHGRYLFVEKRMPGRLERLDWHSITREHFNETRLVLSIPLTIRKETVMRKVRGILNQYYDRQFDVIKHSTALLKLHTGRYRQESIAVAYDVWINHRKYVTLMPEGQKKKLWEIGEMLNLAGESRLKRGNTPKEVQEKRRMLNALVSRYLRKANALIKNVEIGRFPCYDENVPIHSDRFNDRQRRALQRRDAEWDALVFAYPSLAGSSVQKPDDDV